MIGYGFFYGAGDVIGGNLVRSLNSCPQAADKAILAKIIHAGFIDSPKILRRVI